MKILKDERPSGSMLILFVLFAYAAFVYADSEYVKRDEFSALQETVINGFESIEINDASQTIRGIKMEILITKATTGSTGDLAEELGAAKKYKQCLVDRGPNCEFVKEVE